MNIIPKKQQGGNIWDKNIVSNIKREAEHQSYEEFLQNLSDAQKKEIADYYSENTTWKEHENGFEEAAKKLSTLLGKNYIRPMSATSITAPVKDNEDEIVDETSSTKNWEDKMTQLNYTPARLTNGNIAYKGYDGTIYYNNGRMKQNGRMLDYDYNILKSNTPVPVSKSKPKFNSDKFKSSDFVKNLKTDTFGNTTYYRYDPDGPGDFYINTETGEIYKVPFGGGLGTKINHSTANMDLSYNTYNLYKNLYEQLRQYYKTGGKMNKIKYFQQGGAAPQQDLQQQVIALVQAAMQGDQQATQQVNQIMEAAKSGDPQATQIAQMIQQVVQQMQGQATSAKWGAKLRYIQSLKYAKGGKTCPECEKKKIEEKKCGGKAKKRYFGGIL